jgi:hypothetical protein
MIPVVARIASMVPRPMRMQTEPPCPVCKLRLNTGAFATQDLWKLGLKENWKTLKSILQPIVNPEFAVADLSSRMLVDRARRMFDKAIDEDGDTIVRVIMVDQV